MKLVFICLKKDSKQCCIFAGQNNQYYGIMLSLFGEKKTIRILWDKFPSVIGWQLIHFFFSDWETLCKKWHNTHIFASIILNLLSGSPSPLPTAKLCSCDMLGTSFATIRQKVSDIVARGWHGCLTAQHQCWAMSKKSSETQELSKVQKR